MRPLSEIEILRIKTLTENSVEFTLIEPTKTGLLKSILDATGLVRMYLKNHGIHDYAAQGKGPSNRVYIKCNLIERYSLVKSLASLYRPETKNGDPRIWFKFLGDYCNPNDMLAIIAFQQELYIVNLTSIDVEILIATDTQNPLKEIVNDIRRVANKVTDELLKKLREIAARGPIKSLLNADTAIGRTLETLLGIQINSSKTPDYNGIELKSYRDKKGNRKNLFAQVADWEISKLKSSAEVLDAFGYARGSDFKLYCTVSTLKRNAQGLILKLDGNVKQLIENSDKNDLGDCVVWKLDTLHKRLVEKHNETFWIAADSTSIDGHEHFLFSKVEHTRKPIVSQFDILLEQGIITVDHLIKRKQIGNVSEKGPLFKIKPDAVGLLFPPSNTYDLLNFP